LGVTAVGMFAIVCGLFVAGPPSNRFAAVTNVIISGTRGLSLHPRAKALARRSAPSRICSGVNAA